MKEAKHVNVSDTISEYLHQTDWRVNANANQGYSLGGLILNSSGKMIANYWLHNVYSPVIAQAHINGDMHIHDLDMFSGYCAGWSLRSLLEEGFNGVAGKIESTPPKNLATALGQMVNFLGTLQNEWAGAQAFSSFDTYLAPFVRMYADDLRKDIEANNITFPTPELQETYIKHTTYMYVYDSLQSFIFNLNVPSRWGNQTPFTNLTFDWTCPADLREKSLFVQGEAYAYTFGELEKEMGIINRAFLEIMSKGDAKGRVFTFPIPTYNITKDFDWSAPNSTLLFDLTAKYGLPYFQNFLNSDMNPGDVRSMCCRLQLDLRQLEKRGNGLFGSSEMTGSIGVVTINLARLGYTHAGNIEGYLAQLDTLLELAKESLEKKREEMTHWLAQGLFPYTKRYLGRFMNHFSTIGVNGLHESLRNFFSDAEDIATEKGRELGMNILAHIREKLVVFQETTGHLYNLEATPGEGTTYRFAKEDKKRFPHILQAGTEEFPYYTNSSQLPVEQTQDAFAALEHQDDFQKMYTGGTVLHLYMGERLSSGETCKKLVKTAFEKFRLPYLTISPTFSICPVHGYLAGEHHFCPTCDDALGIPEHLRASSPPKEHTSSTKQDLISIH